MAAVALSPPPVPESFPVELLEHIIALNGGWFKNDTDVQKQIEAWSKTYYEEHQKDGIFLDCDSVYVSAYSVVMLYWDHFTKTQKNRMTKPEYFALMKATKAKAEFPEEFLSRVYDVTVERAANKFHKNI